MIRLLLAVLLAFASAVATAQTPLLPAMSARAWLLLDVTANHLVAASNADERMEPASLTKLASA